MAYKLAQSPFQNNMADVQRTLRQQYPDMYAKPEEAAPGPQGPPAPAPVPAPTPPPAPAPAPMPPPTPPGAAPALTMGGLAPQPGGAGMSALGALAMQHDPSEGFGAMQETPLAQGLGFGTSPAASRALAELISRRGRIY